MKLANMLILGLLPALPLISGCAAGSATAGYALKSQSADDLTAGARRTIIDEAVDKAVSKSKEYADSTFVRKDGK